METSKTYHCIGLMSGTSCDGLDIAFCKFTMNSIDNSLKFEILAADTCDYPIEIITKLRNIEKASALDYMLLNNSYGSFIGSQISKFLKNHPELSKITPLFVASHGHTIFHQPHLGMTAQIGNPNNIAAECGIPVVADFRSMDVALGGQGAPLVPIGDKLLFKDYEFALNLGGIANISYDDINKKRIAFDICPMNMVLNFLAEKKGKEFDENGDIAKQGKIVPDLLNEMKKLDYFNINGPKSLGKEWIFEKFIPLILKYEKNGIENLMATSVCFFAQQIAKIVLNSGIIKPNMKILVTGGGAFNTFFIEKLHKELSGKCEIIVPDKLIVKFKEALIFAFLGLLRWLGKVNSLKSVTGAKQDCVGGIIVNPFEQ